MKLSVGLLSLLVASSLAAAYASDPVGACRAAYAHNTGAHIACLEDALRGHALPVRELGADQVEARKRASEPPTGKDQQAVRIVSVSYDAAKRGVFRMDSDQLWRETEVSPEHQRLSKSRQYTGRIERGTFGGYRLFVDGVRRMVKVERLE